MNERGILFDRCPRCAAPWSGRQVHGVIACNTCHMDVVAPGDDCDRWHGDKEEPQPETSATIYLLSKQRGMYLPLNAEQLPLAA